jgi:predicted nucleic acid-binding protein
MRMGGQTIKGPDLIIAACALQAGAAVATLDSDFDHVPGLIVLRPEWL